MQYWINQNGVQSGPLSREELAQKSLNDKTYIWRSGLPDWVKATELEELADLFQPVESNPPELPDAASPAAETASPDVAPPLPENNVAYSPDLAPQTQQPAAPAMGYAAPQPAAAPVYVVNSNAEEEKPSTNMAWSIIVTLLCCTPLGIAGIVFAILTSNNLKRGDMVKARKMSNRGAWCCILSIVLGIISMPFSMLAMF